MKNPLRIRGTGSAVDLSFQYTTEKKMFRNKV